MIDSQNYIQARSYHDLQGLQSLKKSTQGGNEAAALKEASKHFEAFFLQMILKSARQANSHINGEEGLFNSQHTKFYEEMLDEQMAVEISVNANQGSGLGVADMLNKQLTKKTTGASVKEQADASLTDKKIDTNISMPRRKVNFANVDAPDEFKVVGLRQTVSYKGASNKKTTPAKQQAPVANLTSARAKSIKEDLTTAVNFTSEKLGAFVSPTDFVKKLYPVAQKVADGFGLDPKILLAQSALETGWGKFVMADKGGSSSHNLFGIKADARWKGDSTRASTIEFRGGVAKREIADFRSYMSFEESMQDYVKFLQTNPRYEQALKHKHNPEVFAGHLQKAGYATDPRYSAKIINIMNTEYLQDLDKMRF